MTDERDIRREYAFSELTRAALADSPFEQFGQWLQSALDAELKDATAMALATANSAGQPSVRIVLMKHFDQAGFCWYTDYRSVKARDLDGNDRAELMFYWREFDRQVRISGRVDRLSAADGDAYFASRPVESKLSAAASEQSAVIGERSILEARVAGLKAKYPEGNVPKPEDWGGYRLAPDRFEFWQGREGRLHDRFSYTAADAGWHIERLQP